MMDEKDYKELYAKLKKMRFSGMAKELENLQDPQYAKGLTADQIIHKLIMAEDELRTNKKVERYMKQASLRYDGAVFNNSMTEPGRGLSAEDLERLKTLDWIDRSENIIITGAAGTGKSYLASAIGAAAVSQFRTVKYERTNLLLNDLKSCERRFMLTQKLEELEKKDVLILDDFGMTPFDTEHCRALFELLESREGKHPTVIISQFPVSAWYSMFREATYADACMDRILGSAVRIELKGESRRFHPETSGRKEKSC